MKKQPKTSDAQRRATAKYTANVDRTTVYIKKGYKDRIKEKYNNISISEYINNLIENDLNIKEDTTPVKHIDNITGIDPADIFINYNKNN